MKNFNAGHLLARTIWVENVQFVSVKPSFDTAKMLGAKSQEAAKLKPQHSPHVEHACRLGNNKLRRTHGALRVGVTAL